MKSRKLNCFLQAVSLVVLCSNCALFGQTTAFTYQGRLIDSGGPANGIYDFQFYLRDALVAGNPVGATNTLSPVAVSNGLFAVSLDFGTAVFDGSSRWLEIGVRTNGSLVSYDTLSPRQPITPTPYAIRAANLSGLRTEANEFSPNVIGGYSGNLVTQGRVGATISGGGVELLGTPYANSVGADFGTIGGGWGNSANGN